MKLSSKEWNSLQKGMLLNMYMNQVLVKISFVYFTVCSYICGSRKLKMIKMERLTRQEEDVMRWKWKLGPCFIKDVLAKFSDPKPPYTTVASVVKNLERKKYVKAKRYGNTYEYTPLIPLEEYKHDFMGLLVNHYYANSYKEMVSFFAKKQEISTDELKEIIDMIEKGEE